MLPIGYRTCKFIALHM